MSDPTSPIRGDYRLATYYRPPRTFWQRLGFGRAHAPRPDDGEEWVTGWTITNTHAYLGWKDRLRVLVSGRIHVELCVRYDGEVRRSAGASAISVMPPQRGHKP